MIKRLNEDDIMFVNRIMRDKQIYPYISDDGCPNVEDFTALPILQNEGCYVLSPDDNSVFIFYPWNYVTYEVHTCILPDSRGVIATMLGREVCLWMFDYTFCRKIVTHIPVNNPSAYALAYRVGFRKEGLNKQSFLKNNELHDQILMGLYKGVVSCQQQ